MVIIFSKTLLKQSLFLNKGKVASVDKRSKLEYNVRYIKSHKLLCMFFSGRFYQDGLTRVPVALLRVVEITKLGGHQRAKQ